MICGLGASLRAGCHRNSIGYHGFVRIADIAPSVMFIPSSGADGAGEYFRCITIAQGVCRRWPLASIRFIINREAGYARDVPFEAVLVDGTPTFNTATVNRAIAEMRADIVVFDSAGRVAQIAHARRCGAATVYVSSRDKTRWKGFRLRRMRHLEQHWLAWPRFLGGHLTRWERLKIRLMRRPEIVFLDPLLPALDAGRAAEYRRGLGIEGRPYLLVCAGAGGYQRSGIPAPEVFVGAAARAHQETGIPVVWIKGPNYRGDWHGARGVLELGAVTPSEMLHLLAGAQLAVVNGGSLLPQALAVKTVCVAAPIAGDQAQRIDACVRQGLAVAARLEVESIAAAILRLLQDPAQRTAIRSRLQQLNVGNGVDQAVDALALLLSKQRITT
jgi:hypothetical protein